ncbi:MmcQ/YjbR family DNA-binding protein [Glutamicibacter soli]|uniref:MmcQ-like protein n=1 Tax=Glutamicibacter soli TaxID=453836 RepID=A0A365YCD8_9MICC|nr:MULTISPECIES: MmcQ/YjbR family DNA-binding protein [Micrococcaceae]ALD62837.1 MmcQ-like protein [Arthrobacter sp. LS16]ALQ32000.1 MmcQ-like protein [Arthrobacter sp. YC-RL1]KLI90301.1 MmcQ-like protein [Arthrobacter sp. YC-RL1]RBM00047.1 MmcQ-like protein [Glutamicibacter soli]
MSGNGSSHSDKERTENAWRALCLQMPRAYEDHPFGPETTVFKVAGRDRENGKLFALIMHLHGELLLNLKCEPALADQQRSEHPEITPGYHMNKKHWNSVRMGLDEQTMRELIEDSYDLVVDGMPNRDKEVIRRSW